MSDIQRFWERNGKIVVGNNGAPVKCGVCPCTSDCYAIFITSCSLNPRWGVAMDGDICYPVNVNAGCYLNQQVTLNLTVPEGVTITGCTTTFSPTHTSLYYNHYYNDSVTSTSYTSNTAKVVLNHNLRSIYYHPDGDTWCVASTLVNYTKRGGSVNNCSITASQTILGGTQVGARIYSIQYTGNMNNHYFTPAGSGTYTCWTSWERYWALPLNASVGDTAYWLDGWYDDEITAHNQPQNGILVPYYNMDGAGGDIVPIYNDTVSCTNPNGLFNVYKEIAFNVVYTTTRNPSTGATVYWIGGANNEEIESDGAARNPQYLPYQTVLSSGVDVCNVCNNQMRGGIMRVPEEFE